MATTSVPVTNLNKPTMNSELPPKGGTGWKNRFLRRGSSRRDAMKDRRFSNGSTRSRSNSESSFDQQAVTTESDSKNKKGGRFMRKIKTSFNRENSGSSNGSGGKPSSTKSLPYTQKREASHTEGYSSSPDNEPREEPFHFASSKHDKSALLENPEFRQMYEKQQKKERDGFCRRVDAYDGQVVFVDGKATYELGNYLGGGVAGVVYEGHRLRPMEEYPVRNGSAQPNPNAPTSLALTPTRKRTGIADAESMFCGPMNIDTACGELGSSLDEGVETEAQPTSSGPSPKKGTLIAHEEADVAIEVPMNAKEHGVMLDGQDAPSRSKHFAKAASVELNSSRNGSLKHGLSDETVAVKILNPVGFRILPAEGLEGAVVVRKGEPMSADMKKGIAPMTEKHVWWLVNPNSRNLRTLQRYNGTSEGTPRGVQIDRGTPERGLRLSLIAAFVDPRTELLRELTLTRCIEIWGHVPFSATDAEFEEMVSTIDRINAGHPPPPVQAFSKNSSKMPTRVGTGGTATTEAESSSSSGSPSTDGGFLPVDLEKERTGLLRVVQTERSTVYCEALNAYIAVPAVPSKYLRWLRQRRSATKEIRNMMLIGRHKNVVHLFEVLEFIQESKSTMFLILELVRGGELFDLISSSASKGQKHTANGEDAEKMMKKFFFELCSGVHYCHVNGIAHRDLKPENLLVHNEVSGGRTLKIADFGLSAVFGPNGEALSPENDMTDHQITSPLSENSIGDSPISPRFPSPKAATSPSSLKDSVTQIASAISFLTCGAMENLCAPTDADLHSSGFVLRRMTSVVGSPHYVAPEIISQTEEDGRKSGTKIGYDGSKADVWSAGVILYAMLFRSLPFGEDLLRCPRYQSYRKWYAEIRKVAGRRSEAKGALAPITEADERDFLGPHWFFPSSSSKDSRDLIVAMLNPFPDDRLSVSMVLQHAWLQEYNTSNKHW